ncbi:ribosome small subunit-dependent GTPase A [Clostridium guangxiense]|uniref:ribosome small subunit-dependent GTPase A n=1 Tax=Clostridium guangxiense TaxID=1662055 RepID=UPI001E320500|nr:ribosome small subunit-dependent GTPase A [Clostridium guangxiense]MCD2346020.1 ribosome small subunit-dependent GTPase A [Clostridium guangxiense]
MQGIIVKGIAGFYYVKVGEKVYECKARGKFRFNEMTPIVGDRVLISVDGDKGVIDKIQTRFNELKRPLVANITQAFVVFAMRNPNFNNDLFNKFLVLCEAKEIKPVICFNKIDMASDDEISNMKSIIETIGYEYVMLNAKSGIGMDALKDKLSGNVTVVCGVSGVGKSTIFNGLVGKEAMQTGDVSEKIKRGKHTTRHSELIELNGGFLVDTPGFSSLDIKFLETEELKELFPEFLKYSDMCKFSGCLHYKEPECEVKEAVNQGKIHKSRYDFYVSALEELKARRKYK